MNDVVREYFRQRLLDPTELPVVCWHVAMINCGWDYDEALYLLTEWG